MPRSVADRSITTYQSFHQHVCVQPLDVGGAHSHGESIATVVALHQLTDSCQSDRERTIIVIGKFQTIVGDVAEQSMRWTPSN